jgi:hypothetical protein
MWIDASELQALNKLAGDSFCCNAEIFCVKDMCHLPLLKEKKQYIEEDSST